MSNMKMRNKENKPLPLRWRRRHGAYYYRVPPGMEDQWQGKKEFMLGKTLTEAYKTWSEHLDLLEQEIRTMNQVMDRFLLEEVSLKKPKTQESYQHSIKKLRPVFGHMRPSSITSQHAYKYYDMASKKRGATTAKHDVQVLRAMLTACVKWGLLRRNDLLGTVTIKNNPPRDRYVEDWEIIEALSLKSNFYGVKLAKPYIKFKLATGLRRGDIFQLRINDIKPDGIHVRPSKTELTTGKQLIISWDDEGFLRKLIVEILCVGPDRDEDGHLFVTRAGKPYVNGETDKCNAFDSLWQRFMDKVLNETKVKDRFQERDLRAKVASDSVTLEEASDRLAHASTETTKRIYRRKPVIVGPLLKEYNDAD